MEDLKPVIDLAERQVDGMTIILWLIEGTLETYVTVDDRKTNNFHKHPVPQGVSAMEVFNHPFTYPVEESPMQRLGQGGKFRMDAGA